MAIVTKLNACKWLFNEHSSLHALHNLFHSCLNGDYEKREYQKGMRIELESGIFAMLQTYKLKPYKQAFFETHRKYVDFQLVVYGGECFMMGDSSDFTIMQQYDETRDLIVYEPQKLAHRIIANSSCLCVFFPNDVHAGGLKHRRIAVDCVYKVVAKVPKTLLKSYTSES